jgi:hypothetical protein
VSFKGNDLERAKPYRRNARNKNAGQQNKEELEKQNAELKAQNEACKSTGETFRTSAELAQQKRLSKRPSRVLVN